MADTLDLSTIFFTHSAAELQWPELANLICPDDADSRSARKQPSRRTPPLPTGSSTIGFRSLSRHTTWAFSVLLTTGCVSSGSTMAALMSMAWPSSRMLLMSRGLGIHRKMVQSRILFSTLTSLCPPPTQQYYLMAAMLQMLLPPKQIPTSVTRHTLTFFLNFIYIFI